MVNRLASCDQPVPAPARGESGGLVGVGTRGVRRGAAPQRAGPAERRVRRLPLVPRDGARVVRGRGHRGVPQRALRQHQGRPRGAARRRRDLHAGDDGDDRARRLADDRACSTTTATRSSPAPTSPTGRGTGSRRSARCWRRSPMPGRTGPTTCAGSRADLRDAPAAVGRPRPPAPIDAAVLDAAVGTLGASSTPVHGGFGGAPKFPPSMVLEFLLRHAGGPARRRAWRWPTRRSRRWRAAASTTSSAAASRATASTARWVVPHFEKMLYDNAPAAVGVYARWAARRSGARVARGDRRLPAPRAAAPTRAASPPRSTPTPRARRGASTSGRRPSWSTCSVRTTAPGPRRCWGDRGRHLRARRVDAAAASPTPTTRSGGSTSGSGCWPRAQPRVRPARDDKVVAAWNGLAISGLVEPAPLLAEPAYVDAARALRASSCAGLHLVDGRLLPGLARRRRRRARRGARGLRLRRDRLPRAAPAHRRRGLARPRAGAARRRARPVRGPTTAASSTPPTTPRRWSRAARPVRQREPGGLSAMVHALLALRRPHRLGPAPRGGRGGARRCRGASPSRRRGSPAGRWRPRRRARRTGGDRGRRAGRRRARRAGAAARRHAPGGAVVVAEPGEHASRCSPTAARSTAGLRRTSAATSSASAR